MQLIALYEQILKTGLMKSDKDGYISQINKFAGSGKPVYEPAILDGKRLVMPTAERLQRPNPEKEMFFHPLSEDALQGESSIITLIKNRVSIAINLSIHTWIKSMMYLALSVDDHQKLNPDQSEVLSILKNIDEKSEKTFSKLILAGMQQKGFDGFFFRMFLKRGGTVAGKKYARAGIVSSPFYEELCSSSEEIYGIKLRRKDQGVLKSLFEYLLPRISEKGAYDQGSDSDVAPYMDAIMQTAASIGADINRRINEYHEFIPDWQDRIINTGWQKAFNDLPSYMPEIRRIPNQKANTGAPRVKDSMQAKHDIAASVNEAMQTARPAPAQTVAEPAQSVQSDPPFEPTAQLSPQVASYNAGVNPVHQSKPGKMSVSEMFGVTPAQVAQMQQAQAMQQYYNQRAAYGQPAPMPVGYGYQQPMPAYGQPVMPGMQTMPMGYGYAQPAAAPGMVFPAQASSAGRL